MTCNRLWLVIALVTLSGCARTADSHRDVVTVSWNGNCSCCRAWVRQLEQAGLVVEMHHVTDVAAAAERAGVPPGLSSCHTAEVGGYFVEGHVPAEDIKRLLAQRPAVRGIAVPGMPIGSPGMEGPSQQIQPYEVLVVAKDGSTSVYSSHGALGGQGRGP